MTEGQYSSRRASRYSSYIGSSRSNTERKGSPSPMESMRTVSLPSCRSWRTGGPPASVPESLVVVAGDRLQDFVRRGYGERCSRSREWPVHLSIDNQRMSGWIDLLVETGEGYIIFDHKSFPGTKEDLGAKALEYAPQLDAYRQSIEEATGKPVIAMLIHLPRGS